MFDKIKNAFNSWAKRQRVIDELGKLSDRELADMGLSRADIYKIAAGRGDTIVNPKRM